MLLNVNYVTQLEFGQENNQKDPTGCWYSSACMVGYGFSAGPRLGVPALFSKNVNHKDGSAGTGHWALPHGWLSTFMSNENLVQVDGGLPKFGAEIQTLLKKWGPLIVFWKKTNSDGQTYGHASVVIGATDTSIIIHDPENEPHTSKSISEFHPKVEVYSADWPLLRHNAAATSFKGGTVEGRSRSNAVTSG
ncbi:MAG: hypothetical protein ACI9T7_001718 [Oleiphilaceae bacterium]|jgi:hypothetical protein